MTSTPPPPFSAPRTVSASLKSVLLDDWWLVKAQGNNALAVEGFARSLRPAIRTFSSAAISKRHTATTLETIDGIIVTLCGLLNISRTSQNGFPPEIYDRYLLGFPFDWEEHAAALLGQGSTGKSASARNSSQKYMSLEHSESNQLPFSISDVPATATRDFIMSCVGDSEHLKTILDDILRTLGDNVFGDTTPQINSNMEDSDPVEKVESGCNETLTMAKKVHIDGDRNKSANIHSKGSQKSKKGMYSGRNLTGKISVPRRSSARLKNKNEMQDSSMTLDSELEVMH
ncbi:PREDICTED: protein EMBRYO DEFECTIVE 1674-like [Fragaria vesca subsp. vesca]|uniref:protein EMBRYO DEFECTIVE 1674-like n=1 Tax=Fragaria vesca subsp. vesca TaxID=101020 RepID=UPI0002C300CA|nr:PREDICTED: protein EMBRYO DEFECTIVE 1674-like [Fragaria vesca subsp. vesca]